MSPDIETGVYPEDMKDHDQWLLWKPTEDGRKVPRAPWRFGGDQFASAKDPENWVDFETAAEWLDKMPGNYGLAFWISREDPFVLVDYDYAIDTDAGALAPEVAEHLIDSGSYADVSDSGAGVHTMIRGSLPQDVKAIDDDLPGPSGAEIEVYDGDRFVAVTGDHIANTPTETKPAQKWLNGIAEEFKSTTEQKPDEMETEPEKTRTEILDVEQTTDFQDVIDAIKHTDISDVRLRSEVTEDRGRGSKSLDPSWERSKSGTRLGYEDGGFIYRKGMVGLDTLQVVALEERIISDVRKYPRGEDFREAVDALRDRGAPIPEFDWSHAPEPFPLVPIERITALDHDERVRYARKRGVAWPDVGEVRNRVETNILDTIENEEMQIVSAPTGAGKTYATATREWKSDPDVTGDAPVIHLHKTRDARDQAHQMSKDANIETHVLKGRGEVCPVAKGVHDPAEDNDGDTFYLDSLAPSEWFEKMCEGKGIPFSYAHAVAEELVPGELPCVADDSTCPAHAQWDGVPRTDDGDTAVDVLHATHPMAFVPSIRASTNLAVDERPDFTLDMTHDRVRRAVTAHLQNADGPVSTFQELISVKARNHIYKGQQDLQMNGPVAEDTPKNIKGQIERAMHFYDDEEKLGMAEQPDKRWFIETEGAHTIAPALVRAIWEAEEVTDGIYHGKVEYHPPRFDADADDSDGWNRVYISVVFGSDMEIKQVRQTPDFSGCRSLVGLDAHPTDRAPFWRVNGHPTIEVERTLSPQERTLYRRYTRGLYTVQVGNATHPVTKGKYLDEGQGKKIRAVVQHLRQHYGSDFDSAITSKNAREFVRRALEDAGEIDPEMMHYGAEESRNDFEGKEVGLVVGAIDPGDDAIQWMLAELGLEARPVYKQCPHCGGSGECSCPKCGDDHCSGCKATGEVREHGRTFEGLDADAADAVLHSVREHHVAQSAGRWARHAADPDDHATVYVMTDAAPEGFIDTRVPGVTWATSQHQERVLETLRDADRGMTTTDIAQEVGVTKNSVRRCLEKARTNDLVTRAPGAGTHGATVYEPTGWLPSEGIADLAHGKPPTATDDVSESYTWSVAISANLPGGGHARNPPDERGRVQASLGLFPRATEPPS